MGTGVAESMAQHLLPASFTHEGCLAMVLIPQSIISGSFWKISEKHGQPSGVLGK